MEAALTNPSGQMTLSSAVVRIGSAQDNHVVINDPKVSPHHAEIRPDRQAGSGHTITDLGSATGTFVNGRHLDYNSPSRLYPNDIIRIGDAVFNYEVTGTPPRSFAGAQDDIVAPAEFPLRPPSGAGTPQVGATAYGGSAGDPAFVPTAASSSSSSGAEGNVAAPQRYPSTAYSPPAAFAPPPSQPIAPPVGSPLPTYTFASLLEKGNRRKLWLAVGMTALVILIVALLFGGAHSPGKTLDTYCSALQNGDYQTAYNQLSPGFQGSVYPTEAQFAKAKIFSGKKSIASCTHSSPNVSGNTALAMIMMQAASGSKTVTQQVWLIQDSSFNWWIDALH